MTFYEVLADGYHLPLTKTRIAELRLVRSRPGLRKNAHYVWEISGRLNHCRLRVRDK